MFLDLDGHGPTYAQLTRAMKAAILNGLMKPGTRLPSTRALALELGLSRITVLATYEQLRAEGYIRSRVGSGSYVSERTAEPQHTPAAMAEPAAKSSRYSHRARSARVPPTAQKHHNVRLNLYSGSPTTNPALNTAWGRELARAAAYTPLEHANPQGLLALREQVCDYLGRRRGVQARADEILIVNGSQQASTLTAQALLNENDTVVMEEPHNLGMWQAFAAHGADLHPVRSDSEGLVCADLPTRAPRLICVTPSHQFPAGSALSLPRRQELLRYAEAQRSWILEVDYDSEFRHDGSPLPPLRSLDQGDRVIYVGTFSKLLFDSIRLGYMVLPAALRDDFVTAKYLCDVASSTIEQAALAHFMETGGFERHLRHSSKVLRTRRKELIEGLRRYVGEQVQITGSHVGTHLAAWLQGYDHAQAETLIEHAHQRKLALHAMAPYYHTPPDTPALLLGYGNHSATELHDAMRLFGECLDAVAAMDSCTPDG